MPRASTVGRVAPAPADDPQPLAERLLDAQVAFHLERLGGDEGRAFVARLADGLLAGLADRPLAEVVDAGAVKDAVARALTSAPDAPDGPAVQLVAEVVREVVRAGPPEPFPVGDLVEREQVEALVDALLGLTPLLERGLDRVGTSPQVSALATRFMARIATEALQANQAMTEKVPGIGGLLSLGATLAAGVATGAIGAADKQLDGLLGDTVGRSGTFAVGRLNRVLLDTLRDPATREAALQVWDVVAAERVRGLGQRDPDGASTRAVLDVADAGRDLITTAIAHPHTVAFAHRVVDALVEGYGGYSLPGLLAELGVDDDAVGALAARHAPVLLEAWRESGVLERWLRAELEPFYRSPEVAALLEPSPEP